MCQFCGKEWEKIASILEETGRIEELEKLEKRLKTISFIKCKCGHNKFITIGKYYLNATCSICNHILDKSKEQINELA